MSRSHHILFPPLPASGEPTKNPPPFIANPGIRWLEAPADATPIKTLDNIDPAKFRAARRDMEEQGDATEVQLEPGFRWNQIKDATERAQFLALAGRYHNDPRFFRQILMIEAGMGKTTAAQQALYLRNVVLPQHLAIGCRFANLPESVDQFLDTASSWLIQNFRYHESLARISDRSARELLVRKIRNQQFSLIVDSFDQVSNNSPDKIQKQLTALHQFLNRFPNVRCLCTGRPNSILAARFELFNHDHWLVAQIDGFDKDQRETYVGADHLRHLSRLEVNSLAQPRLLEAVRKLPLDDLDCIRTACEIHARCLEHVLREALRDQGLKLPASRLLRLTACIGYQMTINQNFDGVPHGDEFEEFLLKMSRERGPEISNYFNDSDQMREGVRQLAQANELLDFALLEDGQLIHIYFRNRTLQAFFAALWVTRYSTHHGELAALQQILYLPGAYGEHFRFAEYYEFWQLLCEMPSRLPAATHIGPRCRNDLHFARAVSAIFIPLTSGTQATSSKLTGELIDRSDEMMYRAWWPILELAENRPLKDEAEMLECTRKWQRQVRYEVDSRRKTRSEFLGETNPETAAHVAEKIITCYLSEFPRLVSSQVGSPDQQRVAQQLDAVRSNQGTEFGFVPIPAGRFWFGDDNPVPEFEPEFWIARYPITNEQFRLWDPNHGIRPNQFVNYSDSLQCPAIYVGFYSATMAAFWCHAELPTEQQWEKACRGPQNPDHESAEEFGVGGELSTFAWFGENSGGSTHPVGPPHDTMLANGFGLKHMHGSVWEFCCSMFEPDKPWRVVRGGAFNDEAVRCRSAIRDYRLPSILRLIIGVRFSRARKS